MFRNIVACLEHWFAHLMPKVDWFVKWRALKKELITDNITNFIFNSIGTTKAKELHYQKVKRPVTPIRTFDSGRNYIATAGNFGGGRNNPPDLAAINQQHICELYSDTLDQCFDKSGLYVCKSYGPRCYIIQKVSLHIVEISGFLCHSDFTWNQFWKFLKFQNCRFCNFRGSEIVI